MSKKLFYYFFILALFITFFSSILSCVDTTPPGNGAGEPVFASGPAGSTGYTFAKGIIEASDEILGVFMDNTATPGSLDTAISLVSNNAYMGFVQEDIFRYAGDKYAAEYYSDPDTAQKKYLKIASQLKALTAVFTKNVYLLINTNSVTGVTSINDLASQSSLTVNLGAVDSDTYISAKTIADAYTWGTGTVFSTDDVSDGIEDTIAGTCSAAFLTDNDSSGLLSAIPADADVELIKVSMPPDKKYYCEDGTVFEGDYAFQDSTITGNITVKSVLTCCPLFSDDNLDIFLDYLYTHADDYKSYNSEWANITNAMTMDFIAYNPQNCNYNALCYFTGIPNLTSRDLDPYFCSAEEISAYHKIATELIWLLSHNLDLDLKEKNTTGTWENSYWMLGGGAAMTLAGDDIFKYLIDLGDNYSILQAASTEKIAPLGYEYVHLAINTDAANWTHWTGGVPDNLAEMLTHNPAGDQVLKINVGPKTSGTFMSAMKIIRSYESLYKDAEGNPLFEMRFFFDSASDSIANLGDGDYHAAFVVSGLPYSRFYPHDTYDVPSNIALIPAEFYNGNTPYPYETGALQGNASTGNYPYRAGLLPEDTINTVRIRTLLAASPVLNNSNIGKYIISIFRKAFYMLNNPDPGNPDFLPDPLWTAIMTDSFSASDSGLTDAADYDTYGEDITGAKEYFVKEPFGWNKYAVEHYLTLFPDN